MDVLVDDIEQVRLTLGYEKIGVLGHSIFGLVALEYARAHPERTTFIIMNGTPPLYNKEFEEMTEKHWESRASTKRKTLFITKAAGFNSKKINGLSPSDIDVMKYIAFGSRIWYNPGYDASELVKGIYWNVDLWNYIYKVIMPVYDPTSGERISTPVFLALGRFDFTVPPHSWNDYVENLENMSFNIFDKSGHYPMLEERELFDSRLIEWISRQE
jgi:proline iminopeptidase